jgi:hypothetical protein
MSQPDAVQTSGATPVRSLPVSDTELNRFDATFV